MFGFSVLASQPPLGWDAKLSLPEMDGMTLKLPNATRNMMVD